MAWARGVEGQIERCGLILQGRVTRRRKQKNQGLGASRHICGMGEWENPSHTWCSWAQLFIRLVRGYPSGIFQGQKARLAAFSGDSGSFMNSLHKYFLRLSLCGESLWYWDTKELELGPPLRAQSPKKKTHTSGQSVQSDKSRGEVPAAL